MTPPLPHPKSAVSTPSAPAAIGPYSQAVRVGDAVYVSGQIPLDPATGQPVAGGIAEQTERVLLNLAAILRAAGCSPRDVVKTTIYLVDLGSFAVVNEVYARHFEPPYPARATVQVSALPRGALVEIDAIAAVPDAGVTP
jgi:2-iminobutanoate/2-iminopropanoate deaminase